MHLETIHVCPIQHRYIVDENGAAQNGYIRQDDGESGILNARLFSAAMNAKIAAPANVPSSLTEIRLQ